MKTRFFFTSLLFILLQATLVRAQHLSLKGKVQDQQTPVAGAQVFLLQQDQILLAQGLTDDSGHFELNDLPLSPCFLKVIMPGYEAYHSEVFELKENSTLPTVQLSVKSQGLKEVTVSSKKPLIQADAEKLVLNVSSSITSEGSTALEVLQQAPNVQVDQNDNISMKGKQGVMVYIDGRQVPLQGADLAALLKGMPASSIDKIELITNPSARYDAAGTAGVIHIKTKKERKKGFNGTVTGSYNQGIYSKFNGGLSLNYRQQKVSAYVNYNGSQRIFTNELELKRRFISGGTDTIYHQHIRSKFINPNHQLTAGVDYALTPKSSIGLVFTGGLNHFQIDGNSTTTVSNAQDAPLFHIANTTNSQNDWNNYALNLNLRQQLGQGGKTLAVDADYARYRNYNTQQLSTQMMGLNGAPLSPVGLLLGNMDGYTDIRSLKADYEQAIDERTKLEAGAKSSFVTADNAPNFYNNSSGTKEFDAGKSNHFVYTENINAAYINGSRDWEKWNVQLGLRLEHTKVEGHEKTMDTTFNKQYVSLFPNIAAVRHLNSTNDLGISISRRIERPNYRQLNPFRSYLDQSSIHQGNPGLDPALTWSVELNHIYKGRFTTSLGFSRTTAVITQVIKPGISDDGGKMTIITDDNLAVNTNYSLSGAYPLQLTKWWSSTNAFTGYYSSYEGNLEQTALSKGSLAYQLSSTNTFTLPRNFNIEVSGWYQSAQVYGYMELKPMYGVNAGIQKQFWDRKASLKLSVNDIFRSISPRGTSTFATYQENFIVRRDTRTVGISFSYRFGNSNLGQMRKGKAGATEEMQRAGG